MDNSNKIQSPIQARLEALQQLKQQEEHLTAKQDQELQLLELIDTQYDDLEDFTNWTQALSQVSITLQQTINHYYYK